MVENWLGFADTYVVAGAVVATLVVVAPLLRTNLDTAVDGDG